MKDDLDLNKLPHAQLYQMRESVPEDERSEFIRQAVLARLRARERRKSG